MKYLQIEEGVFIERPNRFVAKVLVGEKEVMCHVKNTGRCKEILIPGVRVYVNKATNTDRKTPYDLIAVYKGKMLINIDSQAPNQVFKEWVQAGGLFKGYKNVKREVTYGHSRFDLWVEDKSGRQHFIEVKGVTLESNGKALFPDAPTQRGVKHVMELIRAKQEGYGAHIMFVIQLKGAQSFSPNEVTHEEFGQALRLAKQAGVKIHAYDCLVTPHTLEIDSPVPIKL